MSSAPDPHAGLSDTPPPGRTPSRQWRAVALFLLVITAVAVVALIVPPTPVQVLAAVVSAVCALWQLLLRRGR